MLSVLILKKKSVRRDGTGQEDEGGIVQIMYDFDVEYQ